MNKKIKIKQIIPVDDVWEKSINEDGSVYFNKAIALAFIECEDFDAIHYLFRYDLECIVFLDEIQNPSNFFFTHEIDPELLKKSFNKPNK